VKRYLFLFSLIVAVANCQAQTKCDSVYAAEDKFREGKIGLLLFDAPPRVITGKDKLIRYTGDKNRTGIVAFRLLIDNQGMPSCLRFSGTNNQLLVEEATQIVQTLSFAPALTNGKGVNSSTFITIRFLEEAPKKRHKH